ncbi:MAG: hypothetical protein IJV36_02195 [Prevotella sp.]|nr:hypothetical protein [Prevotella sp.]
MPTRIPTTSTHQPSPACCGNVGGVNGDASVNNIADVTALVNKILGK